MSDALTYAAPVAKNAGVSIEKPPQWSGRCMMQKSQAQWRDGKPCRVKSPAGTNGKSMGCLKELGVKTSDSKGNTRPIFTF